MILKIEQIVPFLRSAILSGERLNGTDVDGIEETINTAIEVIHDPVFDFGIDCGRALSDRKIPDDVDVRFLTDKQKLEATATLLDKLDDATDKFLAAKGSSHRVDREIQRDLREIARNVGNRNDWD
jgi:hypothetical protein